MSNQLNIETNGELIGTITFNEPDDTLAGGRTGSGFRLLLPTSVNLNRPGNSSLEVFLQDVRIVFKVSNLEFGFAHCANLQTPMGRNMPILFSWDWMLPMLGLYEKLRSGKPPKFDALLYGNLHYRVPKTDFRDECLSTPYPFNSNGEIKYSRDTWTSTLRKLNILDSVLVEIPFPSDPPSDWDEICECLRDAREALDKGGSSGWKGCAMAVRSAFEKWSKKEKENQGPGWPSKIDIKEFHKRTKQERTDAIRWHVYQLAHYFAHNNAKECNREDAILVLTVLSALLDVRKP